MKVSSQMGTAFRVGIAALLAACLGLGCGARTMIGQADPDEDDVNDAGPDALPDAPVDGPVYDQVNDINGCNPDTCGGCCDEAGNCLTGLEADACGIGGYVCVDCTAFNASCNASTHTCGAAPTCGPATCPGGCCDANGVCRPGNEQYACGSAGMACQECGTGYCDTTLKTCVGGSDCGPSNCPGCCDAYGSCMPGVDTWACGYGGTACTDCSLYGETCDPYSMMCVYTGDCGPWNCGGCCDAWGSCNWGGDTWACGAGGIACQDCSLYGATCDPYSMTCTGSQDCGPWNCAGCCDGWGNCNWGGDSFACGSGGNWCEDCASYGMSCDPYSLTCVGANDCGPWNCPGCCDAWGYCYEGNDDWACGSGGGTCMDCASTGSSCDPDTMQCASEDCGPWNCAGCCTTTYPSNCVDGVTMEACGYGGQICSQCTYPSVCAQTPVGGGSCLPAPPQDGGPGCGPWNCEGCCTDSGQCRPGMSDQRCGLGGIACQNCAIQNLSCENGTCI